MEPLSWSDYIKSIFGIDYRSFRMEVLEKVISNEIGIGFDEPLNQGKLSLYALKLDGNSGIYIDTSHIPFQELYELTSERKAYDEKAYHRKLCREMWETYDPLYHEVETSYRMNDEQGMRNAVSKLITTKMHL